MVGKPEEVFAVGFVANGQDFVDGYVKELKDVKLLMLVADPSNGESYPWGALGRYHRDYVVDRGRVGKKADGFNSTFTDPDHWAYWESVKNSPSESGKQYKFRMKIVNATLKITDVEANAIEATRGYLSEILTGLHEAVVTISPRSKRPIVHREGQRECIILEDSEWKDYFFPQDFQQCEGITQAGKQCTAKTKNGKYCAQHTPKEDAADAEKELVTNPAV